MNEREFVDKKRADWDRLAALVQRAGGVTGVRVLTREEIQELGPLYRRVSSDLAYARLHASSADLVVHLNGIVGRAHALLFEAETSRSPAASLLQFYLNDFPALLQKRFAYFAAAVAMSVIGGLLAYWLVIRDENNLNLFVPAGALRESVKIWKSGKVSGEANGEQAGALFQHNAGIGMAAFALGPALAVPTLYLLFMNGAMLGGISALMTQVHRHGTFWPGILPHGIAELTAIFICGAAGLLIGFSLLLPGRNSRLTALKRAGADGVKLALGTIPLFLFAGVIEGMFSHLPIPAAIRLTFAGVNGLFWYIYLFVPRSSASTSEDILDLGTSRAVAA